VKALQKNLGTSYKDASHQLYMAKVVKLERQDLTLKSYATLMERMEYDLESSSQDSDNNPMADP
jgi:hypothetical protein